MSLLILALLTQSYGEVDAIFRKHCVSCHNPKELKGELNLESHAGLLKGGENGPVVDSLVAVLEHAKKPFMPPPKKAPKLGAAEIDVVRKWVAAGAPAPKAGEVAKAVDVPKIAPKVAPRRAVGAIAAAPKQLAVARLADVEILDPETRAVTRKLAGHAGPVLDLAFSADGKFLAAAGGERGVAGEVKIWADAAVVKTLKGHADAIYAVAFSPDGKLLATGSYDRDVVLWDLAAGKPLRTLEGHNEAVFDVAFRPDGKILASASADRTVKLWDVESGQRRETLNEATKALHAVAWSADGRHVYAGGVDNRVRQWEVSADAKEGTNALRASVFTHEGAILAIRFSGDGKTLLTSADDRTVKLWNAGDFSQKLVLEAQPDWPVALAFALDDKTAVVGRLDGTLGFYASADGKPLAQATPEPGMIRPRGLRRGAGGEFKITGKNLGGLASARTSHPKVQARVLKSDRADEAWVEITAAPDAPPAGVDVWVSGPAGEAGPLKVWVDDLLQIGEKESNASMPVSTPASVWGSLASPTDQDVFAFEARKGETLVFDLAAKRLGSKLEAVISVSDAQGRLLASNIDYEGEADPFLAWTAPADGLYHARVRDLQHAASAEHFYRLSVGALPVVTGAYPLTVPAHAESTVVLVGHNLPPGASVRVKAGAPGDVVVPAGYRSLREIKVKAVEGAEPLEVEGDAPNAIAAPGGANGRIGAPGDVDLWRFEAKKGQAWVIETLAARMGSAADTKIEILSADGKPVPRVLLRAARDSWLEFRAIDANAIGGRYWQWEEMELGQYLYMNGEVVRLFLAPRGPDSQWDFFASGGKRLSYFDTSAVAHPLDEPAYIVDPHPPGTKLPPNGLPVFTLHYANDDDASRKLGADSRLTFTAPADGAYLARVRDVRSLGGERHTYRLSIREAKPDFNVSLEGQNSSVPEGSGRNFTVRVDRVDGFDGPVSVEISGMPPGFTATSPLTIYEGHLTTQGTLYAGAGAPKPAAGPAAKLVARAMVRGKEVVKEANAFGAFSLAPKPQVRVFLEPVDGAKELAVVPGKEIPALLKIERNGFEARVTFDVEGLPFGVIVGDIGLSGVLIPEKETERRIFLQCAPWVAPEKRWCHARAREVGNPTSPPVPFTVLPR
ncbi:MAG TPA: c-type cytochrome domain-containing protein [Planctomycetota bacterium]